MQVNQTPFPGEEELFEDSVIGKINCGEGLLDFGVALILRLFKNTEVGVVEAETDPDSSRMVRLCFKFGSFTGRLNQPRKEVVFDTQTWQGSLFSARIFSGARSKYDCQRRWVRLYT